MKTLLVVLGAALAILGASTLGSAARASAGGTPLPASDSWSCKSASRASCAEWDLLADAAAVAEKQAGCEQTGGVLIHAPCPKREAVGSCGASDARIVYYAARDVTHARRACSMLGGAWRLSASAR